MSAKQDRGLLADDAAGRICEAIDADPRAATPREPETPQTEASGRLLERLRLAAVGPASQAFRDGIAYATEMIVVEELRAIEREAAALAAPGAALDDLAGFKVFFTADDIRAAKAVLGNAGDRAEGLMFVCADIVAAILDQRLGATPKPRV